MTPRAFKAFRVRHGLRQADLAEALGVSRHRIIAVEAGRVEPGRTLLLAMAAHEAGLPPHGEEPLDLPAIPRRVDVGRDV